MKTAESTLKIRKTQLTAYSVQAGPRKGASIIIQPVMKGGGFRLIIISSMGNYSHAWTDPGAEDPFEFLHTSTDDYLMGKLSRKDEFNPDATTKAIKEFLIQKRRADSLHPSTARKIWDQLQFASKHYNRKDYGDMLPYFYDLQLFELFEYRYPKGIRDLFTYILRPFLQEMVNQQSNIKQ